MNFVTALQKSGLDIEIRKDVSMKDYSTFRAGGKAKFFVEPKDSNEVVHAVLAAINSKTPYYIVGNGSNILVLQENDVKIITDLMMGGDGTNIDGELGELHLSAISLSDSRVGTRPLVVSKQ